MRKSELFILLMLAAGCREVSVPRPRGYYRIDLPPKNYVMFDRKLVSTADVPATFEFPAYGTITSEKSPFAGPGWFNIEMPKYHAKIHLTYLNIKNDLDSLLEQNYKINYTSHSMKADAINQQVINIPENKVYGILYDLKGNTATSVEFFVTDSTRNYLRGSLYFSAEPNPDSLAPVIDFFREDIIHLIETLKWTEN